MQLIQLSLFSKKMVVRAEEKSDSEKAQRAITKNIKVRFHQVYLSYHYYIFNHHFIIFDSIFLHLFSF